MGYRFDLPTAYSYESLEDRERRELGHKLESFSKDPDGALATGLARWVRTPIELGGAEQDLIELRGPNHLRLYLRSVEDGWLAIDLLRNNVFAN